MKKNKEIGKRDVYVVTERMNTCHESGDFTYNIWFYGNAQLEGISADDAREIIACLQYALNENEKGGKQ